jgi:hypothetical protein
MRHNRLWVLGLIAILSQGANTALAEPFPKTLEKVKYLAGCFDVTYRFVEDGVHDLFSEEYRLDKPTREWIGFKSAAKNIFVLQHATISNDHVDSHFHEVWEYHPNENTWTQEVWNRTYEDEGRELRYQCTAPWKMNTWQCDAGRAKKPFRDSGAPFGFNRTDYELLARENTLLVTPQGWVQNEHNKKITSSGTLVSHELGWITYRRLEDQACKAALEHFPRETAKTE